MKLMICIILFGLCIAAKPLQAAETGDLVWWRLNEQKVESDGTMVVSLELLSSGSSLNSEPTNILIKLTPWVRSGNERIYGLPQIYEETIKGPFPRTLTIKSGRSEQVEIWAETRRRGKAYYARTTLNLYGHSKFREIFVEKETTLLPDWPGLAFMPKKNYYRAQTGEPITLRLDHINQVKKKEALAANQPPIPAELNDQTPPRRLGFDIEKIAVIEGEQKVVSILTPQPDSSFVYTAPHDSELSKAGSLAWKDLLFVSRSPDGQTIMSFYLPLYRSFYGNLSWPKGLALLGLSIAISLALAWHIRRRYPWR